MKYLKQFKAWLKKRSEMREAKYQENAKRVHEYYLAQAEQEKLHPSPIQQQNYNQDDSLEQAITGAVVGGVIGGTEGAIIGGVMGGVEGGVVGGIIGEIFE